jgi:uncharacterized protein (DUF1330 family)
MDGFVQRILKTTSLSLQTYSETNQMSALLVIELDVKDSEALKEYSSRTPDILTRFGGELLLKGKPSLIHETETGSTKYSTMVVFKFPTREAAQGWYSSAEYQSLIPVRDKAMNSTFRILA